MRNRIKQKLASVIYLKSNWTSDNETGTNKTIFGDKLISEILNFEFIDFIKNFEVLVDTFGFLAIAVTRLKTGWRNRWHRELIVVVVAHCIKVHWIHNV